MSPRPRMSRRGRETSLVELVDGTGAPVGATTVEHAHNWPGVLHRAFSVLLIGDDGRMLLQRRSAIKTRFALRWANACCGHPAPGEGIGDAASARLREELGLRVDGLQPAGIYVYRAADVRSGRVEHEYDHVLAGRVGPDVDLAPDPDEVADLCWVTASDLRDELATRPNRYAPWLAGVVSTWYATTRSTAGRPGGR